MTIETDLQDVVSATSALNQTVQGQIDNINTELDAQIAASNSANAATRNALESDIASALANLDVRAATWGGWQILDEPVAIAPACVVGDEWAIDDVTGEVRPQDESLFDNNDIQAAAPRILDHSSSGTGTYVAGNDIAVNPWEALGAADSFDPTLNAYTTGESWPSPQGRDNTSATNDFLYDADGNTVPAYHDFDFTKAGVSMSSVGSSHYPTYTLDDQKVPYLLLAGAVEGSNHRSNRTFVQFANGNVGSHDVNRRPRQGDSNAPFYNQYNDAKTRVGDRNGSFFQPSDAEIATQIANGEQVRQGMFALDSRSWTGPDQFGNANPNTYGTGGGSNYPSVWAIPFTEYNGTPMNRRMFNWGRRALNITRYGVIWLPKVSQ